VDTGAPTELRTTETFLLTFKGMCTCIFHSLRKQATFSDATSSFFANWCPRNECRNSILMTRHYSDLGSDSD